MSGFGYAGQQAFLKYGTEAAILSSSASSLGNLPALTLAGFVQPPRVNITDSPQGIEAAGAYREVDTVPLARTTTMSANLTLGDAGILRFGMRNSGVTATKFRCLPVMSFVTGATDPCADGDAFSWAVRYGMLNSLSLQYQEGQPITSALEIMALALDTDAVAQVVTEEQTVAAGSSTLTWHHADFLVEGTSYREYIASASVSVNNNVKPQGGRKDLGFNNPLSRIPYRLVPGTEKVQINYRLHAPLPAALNGKWGTVVLEASNNGLVTTGAKTLTVTISHNMIATSAYEGGQVNNPLAFSASTSSRYITIVQS